mmetsp:Transcript_61174/g.99047  ORF Transcript_61174/g.99047 Transcript_61174/m.99047 type:complete len:255 (-) Transcript_61174:136-900(-)
MVPMLRIFPPIFMCFVAASSCVEPTLSTTTSSFSGASSERRASRSSVLYAMAASHPYARSLSTFSRVLVTPITLQPLCLYSWQATMPTAPAAEVTSTVLGVALRRKLRQARPESSTEPHTVWLAPTYAVTPALGVMVERKVSVFTKAGSFTGASFMGWSEPSSQNTWCSASLLKGSHTLSPTTNFLLMVSTTVATDSPTAVPPSFSRCRPRSSAPVSFPGSSRKARAMGATAMAESLTRIMPSFRAGTSCCCSS